MGNFPESATVESTTTTDDDQYSTSEVTDSGENDSSQTSVTDSGENSMAISSPTSVTYSGESRPTNNRTSSDHDDESEDEGLNKIFQAVIGTTSTS